ncbi:MULTISPECIES: hypothetical protein [Arsenophonus]|jgi:hypothetical protein|nr:MULTISPECIES: hypothetical protein [Arsenophonus]
MSQEQEKNKRAPKTIKRSAEYKKAKSNAFKIAAKEREKVR